MATLSRGKIFVISAPSGCGKTTLSNRLLSDGLGIERSVSMTTRPPRPGERDGIDYVFVTERKFISMARRGAFLEHEENFGNMYGTPKAPVERCLREGRPILLDVDVKGALKVRKCYPRETVLIFILPPTIAELEKRLRMRRSDDDGTIRRRLDLAKNEISFKREYDYRVVNDRLDQAYRRLKSIVARETGKTA